MRITLVISTLGSGGAERAMSIMANYWAEHEHDITLITLAQTDQDFYVLEQRVKRVGLGLVKNWETLIDLVRNNFVRVISLRKAIRRSQPDVVISFLDTMNVLTLCATTGLSLPVIVCEQADPRQYTIGAAWELLRRIFYPKAVALVVVASAMVRWAEQMVRKDRIRVIPNPVYVSASESCARLDHQSQRYTIVAMGRLVKQKGFDLLLNAFEKCKDRHPDWSLIILGEGDARKDLEALRAQLMIDDRVTFLGRVKEPTMILRRADLFVMSSRFEGFPLALIEAMACGLPVISTDCPTGPSEIIRNGIDGILVPPNDVEALAVAMDRLMGNQAERLPLGACAVEVVERFGIEKIMNRWDEVISHANQATTID